MIIVHYEVYVLEGRGWMLHARFPRVERDTALLEAKGLEGDLKLQVRVVRETYYTDNNVFEENEIYVTGGRVTDGGRMPERPVTAIGDGTAVVAPAGVRRRDRRGGGRRSPTAAPMSPFARQMLTRSLSIAALGLAAALLAVKITPNLILMAWKFGFEIKVSENSYNDLLMTVFSLTFLMVTVPLALHFLPRKNPKPRKVRAGASRRVPVRAPAPPPMSRDMKKSLDKLAREAVKTGGAPEAGGDDDDLPPLPDGMEEFTLKLEDEPAEQAVPPTEPARPAEKDKPVVAEKEVAAKPGGPSLESQVPHITRFLDGALEQCRLDRVNLDNYNRFALHLYLAGAVEAMAEFRSLSADTRFGLTVHVLEVLGTRGEMAENFKSKLTEYRGEVRYRTVMEAGAAAMDNFLLGDEMGAHMVLRDVFRDWNRKADPSAGRKMTVVFTDMVDSTNMTQQRGDAGAQEIVRRHNLIVRNALARFGGNEVKHTGDGIMASFLSAAEAVEAMMTVQRQIAEHNRRMPGQTLHVRIGLNAGEPIQEEDDLFGSTVQLAARVCAAAEADQILCTASVMELAERPSSLFRSAGPKTLKGFRDPVLVYQIMWN